MLMRQHWEHADEPALRVGGDIEATGGSEMIVAAILIIVNASMMQNMSLFWRH